MLKCCRISRHRCMHACMQPLPNPGKACLSNIGRLLSHWQAPSCGQGISQENATNRDGRAMRWLPRLRILVHAHSNHIQVQKSTTSHQSSGLDSYL